MMHDLSNYGGVLMNTVRRSLPIALLLALSLMVLPAAGQGDLMSFPRPTAITAATSNRWKRLTRSR